MRKFDAGHTLHLANCCAQTPKASRYKPTLSDYFSQRIGVPHRFAQQALQNLIADGELVVDADTDRVYPWAEPVTSLRSDEEYL